MNAGIKLIIEINALSRVMALFSINAITNIVALVKKVKAIALIKLSLSVPLACRNNAIGIPTEPVVPVKRPEEIPTKGVTHLTL